MTKKRIFVLTALMCLIFSGAALAQEAGENEHDGFFLRFQLGVGYQNFTLKDSPEMVLSGMAGNFVFQIGGAPANNFILFGELNSVVIEDPKVEIGGASGTADGVSVSVVGIGGGFSYYFMPSNMYLSLSVTASQAVLEVPSYKDESEYGLGITASLGKEWWVSANWGLGIALVGNFSYMKTKADDPVKLQNYYGGIAFSATFN